MAMKQSLHDRPDHFSRAHQRADCRRPHAASRSRLRCVRAPVARRARGADFGFHSPSIKEKLVEVIQLLPQDCTQQRLAEEMVEVAVSPIKEELAEASSSRAPPRAHRGAAMGIPRATEQNENRGGVSASAARAHSRGIPGATEQKENHGSASGSDSRAHQQAHRGPELPKKCRRRKRQ